MKNFEFTIVASCPDGVKELSEKLFEAGCDDATIALQKGVAILDFDREAKNFSHALLSALDNVTAAGAGVLHVEPDDLVSLSDIASRAGITRAAVSNYANGTRGKAFPDFSCARGSGYHRHPSLGLGRCRPMAFPTRKAKLDRSCTGQNCQGGKHQNIQHERAAPNWFASPDAKRCVMTNLNVLKLRIFTCASSALYLG